MSDAPPQAIRRSSGTPGAPVPVPSSLHRRRALGLVVIVAALLLAVLASLAHGANPLTYGDVWSAMWSRGAPRPDGLEADIIVWTQRWPRTLAGILIASALGTAGALMQALTRNPLADPGILGVNAGAGFAVTLGVGLFGLTGITQYIWFAFLGAVATTVVVYVIGSAGRGTVSPVTLLLAGVALTAVLNGFSTFLTLIDPETFRTARNWGLGSLARTSVDDTLLVAPFLLLGVLGAVALSGALNSIALGDDLAASLGTNVARTRVLGIVVVTLLAGGATALTGGIAFVGLMVPHVVRWFVGPDQRWVITYSALAAPVLVLVADVLGRVIVRPGEIEVGVMTALVGAPVLIALVRRREASGL